VCRTKQHTRLVGVTGLGLVVLGLQQHQPGWVRGKHGRKHGTQLCKGKNTKVCPPPTPTPSTAYHSRSRLSLWWSHSSNASIPQTTSAQTISHESPPPPHTHTKEHYITHVPAWPGPWPCGGPTDAMILSASSFSRGAAWSRVQAGW
jgi:hypothetical protein